MRFWLSPVKLVLWLIHSMPLSWQMAIGDALGIFWYDFLRVRRTVVNSNIELAFPQWSAGDRSALARASMRNIGRSIVEYASLPFLTKAKINEIVEFQDMHIWTDLLKRGKGICALAMHVGNGDLANAALSLNGYPSHLLSKEFKLKWLNDLWFGVREKHGTKFIPPRNSSFKCLRALNNNEVVIFVLDQFTGKPIGVKTTFFGVETGTGLGLAVMAERTGAPVMPLVTFRRPDGRHVVRCLPEIPFENQGSKEETQRYMTQKYTDVIENWVRQHPEQWMWIHRRWKKFRD